MIRAARCIGIGLIALCVVSQRLEAQPYPYGAWMPARPFGVRQPARRHGFFDRLMSLFSRKSAWEDAVPRGLTRGEAIDLDFDQVRPSALWLLRLQATGPAVRTILIQRCRFVMAQLSSPLARASAAWMHDELTRPAYPPVGGPPVPPPQPTPPVPPTVPPTVPPPPTQPPTPPPPPTVAPPPTPPPPPTVAPPPTPVPTPTPPPTVPPIPTNPPPPDPPIPTDPPPPDPTGTPAPTPPPPGGHFVMKAGDAMASKVVHQLMAMTAPFMPPPPKPQIPQEEQKAIQQWIDAGCHEETFSTAVKPIFDHRCNTCHAPGIAAGGISFGSYQLLKPHIEFPAGH